MRSKIFEYYHKDIKQLKVDVAFRIVFSCFFLAIFVWQLSSMIIRGLNHNLTASQGAIAAVVLITSILLCLVTFSYAFKDLRIIAAINMTGKCVSSVKMLFSTEKKGFMNLYSILIQLLTLATTLILIACITYAILEITFLSSISFYMPLLFLICMSGYNSIYHIKDEITTQKTVQQQQPLF